MTKDPDHARNGQEDSSPGKVRKINLSAIIEASPDAIFLADAESGLIIEANRQASGLIGRPRKEILGMHQSDLHPKEETGRYRDIFRQHSRKGSAIEEDLFVLHADGHRVPVEITASTIEIDGRQLIYGIFRDVTERKQAEDAMYAISTRYKALLEAMPEIVVEVDTSKVYTWVNGAGLQFFGGDVIGREAGFYFESEQEAYTTVQPLFEGDENPVDLESWQRRSDGQSRLLSWRCKALKDADGHVTGALSTARDITERRLVEEKLHESEEEYRTLFENMMNGFALHEIEVDKNGMPIDYIFLEVNDAFRKLTNLGSRKVIGSRATELLPGIENDPADWIGRYGQVALTGKETRFEHYSEALGKWFSILAYSPGKGIFATLFEDVTERRRAEEMLQQQLKESERSRQATLFMLEDINESRALIEQAKREWEQTFDAVTDPVFLHDDEFRILRANRAYAEQAGMEIGEVIGRPYWEVFPKGDGPLPGCLKAMEKAEEEEEEEEEEISIEDGRIFLSHSYAIPTGEGRQNISIHVIQDITERRQAEMNLEHVNRALTTLSTVNRTLVHADNEPDLLQAICRAIVEQHEYRMAWVGYVQHDKNQSIKIMASAGAGQDMLDIIRPGWEKNESGLGPCGHAVRTGKIEVVQDIAADPDYQQWADALLKCGCAADIALPMLEADGQVFGLLHVYAGEVNAFTDREVPLLQEMAGDLAFGVRALRVSMHRDEILAVNEQQLVQIHLNLQQTIAAVARAVEARDPYTAGHQRRVAELATAIARAMQLKESRIEGIRMGASIHDIGKIHLPAEILSKPS
ncbi:MAG: PAS domain S-box protein, partial [Mariprofundaceae bacterium]|nr:PAS domain S-box protein [Mariprofundaceae bacterium]